MTKGYYVNMLRETLAEYADGRPSPRDIGDLSYAIREATKRRRLFIRLSNPGKDRRYEAIEINGMDCYVDTNWNGQKDKHNSIEGTIVPIIKKHIKNTKR